MQVKGKFDRLNFEAGYDFISTCMKPLPAHPRYYTRANQLESRDLKLPSAEVFLLVYVIVLR
jgi:hypothetical protein